VTVAALCTLFAVLAMFGGLVIGVVVGIMWAQQHYGV
jgi:hypothetical protein